MAASFRYLVFSCCIFLSCHQVVIGLQCYYCGACSSNSNSWSQTSSSVGGAQCSKYVYQAGSVSYIDRNVVTSCNPGPDGVGGTTYCCSTNLCNEGVSLSSSLSLAFALVATVSTFKIVMIN